METIEKFRTHSSPKLFSESSTGSISSGQSEQSNISAPTFSGEPLFQRNSDGFTMTTAENNILGKTTPEGMEKYLSEFKAIREKTLNFFMSADQVSKI